MTLKQREALSRQLSLDSMTEQFGNVEAESSGNGKTRKMLRNDFIEEEALESKGKM